MAIALTVDGVVYLYPGPSDPPGWGLNATGWAQAITDATFQRKGGEFTLTEEADFGPDFGFVLKYIKARESAIATSGFLRLDRPNPISWRNQENTANLDLVPNSSNALTFNGVELRTSAPITNADIQGPIDNNKLTPLTANQVVVSGADGYISASGVSTTTLGFLDATSSVQSQLNAKLNLAGGNMTGNLFLVGNPTQALHAAPKQYVDNLSSGFQPKAIARVVSLTNGDFNTAFDNGSVVDGYSILTGDGLVLAGQTDSYQNGIFTANASGQPTRRSDADSWDELVGALISVSNGTHAGTTYFCNIEAGGTLGVDPVTFIEYLSPSNITTDGEGIELTGNELSLELDGTTLSKSASGLKVDAVTDNELVGPISLDKLDALTPGFVVLSDDPTGVLITGAVSNVELNYLNGATSNIQDQLDALSLGQTVVPGGYPYSANNRDIVLVDTASARTINLPSPMLGTRVTIKDRIGSAQTNNITVARFGSEYIEGIQANYLIQSNWGSITLVSDGTNWFLI